MKIAVLAKQVPQASEMQIGPNGRLAREGIDLEINAFCRRAIAKGVELADADGVCTVITLAPPSGLDLLREAIAWGANRGVLVSDPSFAGSDTLITSHLLSLALSRLGPFDLILVGRNSLDSDTGQVGPGVAQLLGLPFVPSVKSLESDGFRIRVHCEEDDGESVRAVSLPAVVAVAERLCAPCKAPREQWLQSDYDRIEVLGASQFGEGPFGQTGSPTSVGEIKIHEHKRDGQVLSGTMEAQVEHLVDLLNKKDLLTLTSHKQDLETRSCRQDRLRDQRAIAVILEPGRYGVAQELLGGARSLATQVDAEVVALDAGNCPVTTLGSWGADRVVKLRGAAALAQNVSSTAQRWAQISKPWAVILPSSCWGREVAGRLSAALRCGLIGDAIELEVDERSDPLYPRLLAWKPALQGQMVAAIRTSSDIQLVSLRPGVLRPAAPRTSEPVPTDHLEMDPLSPVDVISYTRDDDCEPLRRADKVIAVGAGVPHEGYQLVNQLAVALGAELAASRKVTDLGWLPHSRQVGLTGIHVAPRLYLTLGLSGKYNHMVGARAAGTIVSVNLDRDAPVFCQSDLGIVGDWTQFTLLLLKQLA